MSKEDFIRSVGVVIDELREFHGNELITPDDELTTEWDGHTSLKDDGAFDVECLTCGHINEADYEFQVYISGQYS